MTIDVDPVTGHPWANVRPLWEEVQREDDRPTDDDAWNAYQKFVLTIFGLLAEAQAAGLLDKPEDETAA